MHGDYIQTNLTERDGIAKGALVAILQGTEQVATIEKTSRIVSSPLDTIEACGGGSARCMMAEVFLPESEAGKQH